MKEAIAGGILMVVLFGFGLLISGDNTPDLSSEQPSRSGSPAHPLWSE